MANLDQAPSRTMPNLLHVLPAFANESELRVNTIVELNSNTINKYELITETGHLKLDRVGYSSLSYPFAYGCLPRTWDEDGDPLDIEIVNVTEPLVPGSIVEARIIGIMTFDDGGEVDDKVIGVILDWLRQNVHHYGRSLDSEELVKKVTGNKLSPNSFLEYLDKKIEKLSISCD